MQLEIVSRMVQERHAIFSGRLLLIALLLMTAFSIRIYHIDEPPLDFHATRQYRSLIIARGYYYERLSTIPQWKQQVASLNKQKQGILEPPIMELLTATGYHLFGGERFWISKLLSTTFWLIGAGCLYWIARRIADAKAALFSTAFYLFLPFAVVASRSFQPDSLMVMLLLASILAILRYYDQPSRRRLTVVSILSAAAIFVKPVSLFAIYAVFVLLAFHRHGIKKTITSPGFLVYFPVTFLPTLLFYIFYGIFIAGDLRVQAQASFLPQLLLDPFFWRGWLNNIHLVVGFPTLIGALLGVLMFRKGLSRILMLGLWTGYALFCLVFNYHIATHDYYHLQLVPIVALSLGPVAALLLNRLQDVSREWYWHTAIGSILLLAMLLSFNVTRSRLLNPEFESKKRAAEEVGELVNHSTHTIYLASDYGLSLEYHGELSGRPWPLISDLEWERLAGVPTPGAETRFNDWFAGDSPRYFIVLDLWQFEQQEDLKAFLMQSFSVIAQNDSFVIFDLQRS